MDTTSSTRHNVAATVVMLTALGIAVAALALWLLDAIEPPAGIIGGTAAIIVMMAAARRRKKTEQ